MRGRTAARPVPGRRLLHLDDLDDAGTAPMTGVPAAARAVVSLDPDGAAALRRRAGDGALLDDAASSRENAEHEEGSMDGGSQDGHGRAPDG